MNIKSTIAVAVFSALSGLALAQSPAPAAAPASKTEGAKTAAVQAPATTPAATPVATPAAKPATTPATTPAAAKSESAEPATKMTAPAQKVGKADKAAPVVVSKSTVKAP